MSHEAESWNSLIAGLPGAHLLQTWEWAQVKARYGWQPFPLLWTPVAGGGSAIRGYTQGDAPQSPPQAAAMLLQRTLTPGGFAARLRVLYVPKGPLLDWANAPLRRQVLDDLQRLAHQRKAIFIKIDPDVLLGRGIPGTPEAEEFPPGQEIQAELQRRGWRFSDEQIQFRNTALLDLTPDEDLLLARMKQKTRYNIRLAERKGVKVRIGSKADFGMLYRLYAATSVRDGFVIRDEAYYRTLWEAFSERPAGNHPAGLIPLIAEVEGEAVAGVMLFYFAGKAWYIHGMSGAAHREKMPNALLQWEAIRQAKALGCKLYDLWGAPEVFTEADSMWGVFHFKEGLGAQAVRGLGAWDYPANPLFYRLYTQTLPRLLEVMRRRGKAQTRKITGSL